MNLQTVREYAIKCHHDANCTYDGGEYSIHLEMVAAILEKYIHVFRNPIDGENTLYAAFCHDLTEDARQSYTEIADNTNGAVADIVLAVTDVPSTSRLMKHLLTMGKTVRDHRAIVLKLCDIYANASYSKTHDSSMFKKYKKEYAYRKPIFQQALGWYSYELDVDALQGLWLEFDELFN
jgi:(p)ppGpp synthase/HD superfamily hydrolase